MLAYATTPARLMHRLPMKPHRLPIASEMRISLTTVRLSRTFFACYHIGGDYLSMGKLFDADVLISASVSYLGLDLLLALDLELNPSNL